MSKKRNSKYYDKNIIEALQKLPETIEDKKHNLIIYVRNDQARSNETRFEHIAKNAHELKARDIESIPSGIRRYVYFKKSKELKGTYYYLIKRKGEDRGFIQVTVQTTDKTAKKVYIKTIYIVYRVQIK